MSGSRGNGGRGLWAGPAGAGLRAGRGGKEVGTLPPNPGVGAGGAERPTGGPQPPGVRSESGMCPKAALGDSGGDAGLAGSSEGFGKKKGVDGSTPTWGGLYGLPGAEQRAPAAGLAGARLAAAARGPSARNLRDRSGDWPCLVLGAPSPPHRPPQHSPRHTQPSPRRLPIPAPDPRRSSGLARK